MTGYRRRSTRRRGALLAMLMLVFVGPSPAWTQDRDDGIGGPKFDLEESRRCETGLRKLRVRFTVAKPVRGEGACGAQRPLSVTAINGIRLRPAIQVRCPVARATALWVRRVVAPSARFHLNSQLITIRTSSSYVCRKRRGGAAGNTVKYSQHAFANAVDIAGFELAKLPPKDNAAARRKKPDLKTLEKWSVPVKPRPDSSAPERAFQAAVRGGACAFFTTVIGPMTNKAHADHFHFDMAARRGGYRLCE